MPRDALEYMTTVNPHKPPERVNIALSHTAYALSELRRGADSYELSGAVSLIWLKHLGPKERAFLLAAAIKSSEPRDALFLRDVLVDLFPLAADDVPPLGGV